MSVEAELENSEQYSPLQRMRHSAAHVMAEAVKEMVPDARFAIGPAIEDGFYYDFDLSRPLTPADFPEIEQRMAKIIAGKYACVRDHWPRLKAYFRDRGQPYKVEIIENLPDHEQTSEYLQQNNFAEQCRVQESGNWPGEVTIYQQHNFLDLCRGPHVEHTAGAFPVWLAPFQVRIITIADRHIPHAQEVMQTFVVWVFELSWITRQSASMRKYAMRSNENLGVTPLDTFIERITDSIKTKSGEL